MLSPVLLNLPLDFIFSFFGILSAQKNDIIKSEDEICITPSVLNFNYKLFVRKHVIDIIIHIVDSIDQPGLGIDEDMLDVTHLSGNVRSHILKVLMHEVKAIQEIIVMYTARKRLLKDSLKYRALKLLEFMCLNLLSLILK